MAVTGGTDARILAGVVVLSSVALCVVGIAAVPVAAAGFGLDASALIPLLLGAAGFLVMALVIDPMLTPRDKPSRDEVHVWLSKTFMVRLPATELPALVGLLITFIEQERGPLLLGTLGTLVLAMVWWPGEQFFNAMRRRLQPLSGDRHLDSVLAEANGRLLLKTR